MSLYKKVVFGAFFLQTRSNEHSRRNLLRVDRSGFLLSTSNDRSYYLITLYIYIFFSFLEQTRYEGGDRMAEKITAVRKNNEGDIVELQLSSGQVVDYKQAQQMAKNGEIEHVNVFRGRDGDEHLRSDADGIEENNLDNLPTF